VASRHGAIRPRVSSFEELFLRICRRLIIMSELKNFDRMFRLDGKVALVTGGE
jgi:hypothetical protein